jgi:hypothetical protein
VKQAETFAAIRERYGIERDEALSLRDYPTLGSVVGFVRDRIPASSEIGSGETQATPAGTGDESAPAEPATDLFLGDDERSAGVPRRVVRSVPRPDLSFFAPTGVELAAGSRVIVVSDGGGVGTAVAGRLEKLDVDVLSAESTGDVDALLAAVDEWRGDDPVHGVYWLPALDQASPFSEMDLESWHDALRVRVKSLYRLLRHLYADLSEPGAFVVAGTRLGGLHGYGASGALDPLGGGVVGVVKSFKREQPAVVAKAVDFPASRKTAALADVLIAETLTDGGAVEIGRLDDRRFSVGTSEPPMPAEPTGLTLDADSVFVVTGAAGSIVSAIVNDLAVASGGTFHLLDLVAEPDRDDPDLAAFGADKEGLKRTIFERLKAAGEKATPVTVDRQLSAIERSHAALSAIRAVEAAGGTVHYHSVNLLDADAMNVVTAAIVETSGKVDVLLHAGGIEISKALPEKEPTEFDLVFDIKADGWFHLMHGLGGVPIGATVAFSSVAGRFGNAGQSDYSGANDLLCKLTSNLRTSRPETIGLALDWTAWGDIGMATRGSIPTVMRAAGIDMLPAAAGIPVIRRELTGDASTREQVVGLRLGILAQELAPAGGLDLAAIESAPLGGDGDLVLEPGVASLDASDGLTATVNLDPTVEPFLDDHRIDGAAILPGVMGMEAFATAADKLFPERTIAAVESMQFAAPFKFYRDEPRELKVVAEYRLDDGDPATADILVDCRLIGERMLATSDEPQVTEHFRGRIRLALEADTVEAIEVPPDGDVSVVADDIYEIYFHGPAYQVMERASSRDGLVVGHMAEPLPAESSIPNASTMVDPRLIELCFQTAGVREIGSTGVMALPASVERVIPVAHPESGSGPIRAIVRAGSEDTVDATVIDESGRVLTVLEGYRTIALPVTLEEGTIAPLRAAMGGID